MGVVVGLLVVVLVAGTGSALVLDVDGDGIPAYEEYGATDPLAEDTDGDGLDDDREPEFGSDPTNADTDGDGLTDSEEYWGTEGYGSGIGGSGEGGSGGGDGGDGVAGSAGTEFSVEWERSDPTDSDTDGDG